MIEDFFRGAIFRDIAIAEEENTIRHFTGKTHFVGYYHHRHAFGSHILHQLQHLAHHLGVERRRRLIKEQHLRIHSQGTGDGYTLLLSARKAVGIAICLIQ